MLLVLLRSDGIVGNFLSQQGQPAEPVVNALAQLKQFLIYFK